MRQLLNLRADIKKNTDILFEKGVITTNITLTRVLSEASFIAAIVSGGTVGSGTITLNGIVGGTAASEVLTLAANGVKQGSKNFTSISSIVTAEFTDEAAIANLELLATTKSGEPLTQLITVAADVAVRVARPRPTASVITPGNVETEKLRLFNLPGAPDDLDMGHLVVIASVGATYELETSPQAIFSHKHIHHYETPLKTII